MPAVAHNKQKCRFCGKHIEVLLDCGKLPFANRYSSSQPEKIDVWPRLFGCCTSCGLAQLVNPAPEELLAARVNWLRFNEPESHLDKLARDLLGTLSSRITVASLSAKDTSLVQRLATAGWQEIWRVQPQDLELDGQQFAGIATVQHRIARCATFAPPLADVLVARHMLEHVHALPQWFAAVRRFIRPDGWLLLEVPACEVELEQCDYARLWEEHTQYFTQPSLEAVTRASGFEPVWTGRIHTGHETVLVLLTRQATGHFDLAALPSVADEYSRAQTFAARFTETRNRVRSVVSIYRRKGNVALMGVGHLGLSFAHMMGISSDIGLLLDDCPEKQGQYIDGFISPIRSSEHLLDNGVSLCLFAVNPTVENRIAARYSAFTNAGGTFASVFPASARHLLNTAPLRTWITPGQIL